MLKRLFRGVAAFVLAPAVAQELAEELRLTRARLLFAEGVVARSKERMDRTRAALEASGLTDRPDLSVEELAARLAVNRRNLAEQIRTHARHLQTRVAEPDDCPLCAEPESREEMLARIAKASRRPNGALGAPEATSGPPAAASALGEPAPGPGEAQERS